MTRSEPEKASPGAEIFYGVSSSSLEGWTTFEIHLEVQGGVWWVAQSNPDKYLIRFRNYTNHHVETNFAKTREEAIEKWRETIRRRAACALAQWERLTKLAGTEFK